MDLRTEDYAARGEDQPSSFPGYAWTQVCPDCGACFLATLLDAACFVCNPVDNDPYRKWDR